MNRLSGTTSFRSSSPARVPDARGRGGEARPGGRPQSFTRCAICDTLLYNARARDLHKSPLYSGRPRSAGVAEGRAGGGGARKKAAEILYVGPSASASGRRPLAARSHTRTTWTSLFLLFLPPSPPARRASLLRARAALSLLPRGKLRERLASNVSHTLPKRRLASRLVPPKCHPREGDGRR